MKPNKAHYLTFFYLLYFLFQLQLSSSSLLRPVNFNNNNEEYLLLQTRILGTTDVSCNTDCISNVGSSEEGENIVISLGPSAKFKLSFPIPYDGRDFELKIKPGQTTNISLFLQEEYYDELDPFDSYWTEDDGWMKVTVSGSTIDIYGGGNAVIALDNYGNAVDVVTIKFKYTGLSAGREAFLIILLVIGSVIWIPLVALILMVIAGAIKYICMIIYKLSFGKYHQWSQAQEARVPRAQERVSVYQFPNLDGFGRQDLVDGHIIPDLEPENRQIEGHEEDVINLQGLFDEDKADNLDPHVTVMNIKQRFPEANFEDLESPFPQLACSVCLDELGIGMPCRQLYCKHIFHSECIELWLQNQLLKNKACCPNCNADMMTFESCHGRQDLCETKNVLT